MLGTGGRWALGECARGVTEPPPTRLAPWHSAALFTSSAFFSLSFFLLVPGQNCSDLTTGRLEEGGGKQETILWGGEGRQLKVWHLKGGESMELLLCTKSS